jgi:hypothetical protein
MQDLRQIQNWMQTVIMHLHGVDAGAASDEARQFIDVGPQQVERVIRRSRALTARERLDIYHRAYYARLVECLREEFPVLRHALGDETFDGFALAYLQKYPSRSYTLNLLGANFPRYLAGSRPADEKDEAGIGWPDFLIDLATLEWTYSEVFDGPGVEGQQLVGPEQLQALSAERWPEARLVPVPCLRLLALRYPVQRYYRAVRQEKDPTYPKPARTFLAITRRQFVVRRYELTRLQHVLLSALVAGELVGEAIQHTATAAGPRLHVLASRLQEWFRNWTAEGFFQSIQLPLRQHLDSDGVAS